MKRLFALILCLLLIVPAALADNGYYQPIPDVLRFRQTTSGKVKLGKDRYVMTTLPDTANDAVDAEMAELILAMKDRALPAMDHATTRKFEALLDVGASVFRSGQSVMSFLTVAHTSIEREQTYVDFDARTYDLADGRRLTLTDLFDADSEGWQLMANAVRTQLTAYFAQRQPDAAALDALCTREAIEAAQFTLTPVRLSLHYRADALYPGATTLMHVDLYYPDIRPAMNTYGQRQTDNAHYRMIALTYDDGPALYSSNKVMNKLREYGANATFFVVGQNLYINHDLVSREHDADFCVASHSMHHEYLDHNDRNKARQWVAKFDSLLDSIIGQSAGIMRAPGAIFSPYINAEVGLPQIHWSALSGDAGQDRTVRQNFLGVADNTEPGAIALMHDIKDEAYAYTEILLQYLEAENYLCVTVPELCAHYGVPMLPDEVIHSCVDAARAMAGE